MLISCDGADCASALRQNILGAGDTCSRAAFVGSVLGVTSGVPQNWIDRVDANTLKRIDATVSKIVDIVVGEGNEEL